MSEPLGRMLTPAEFAAAVHVPRSSVYSKLNGAQRDYWRATLDAKLVSRVGHHGDDFLIPETSIAAWHTAEPPRGERGSRIRKGKPVNRSDGAQQAEVNRILMGLSRRAEIEDRSVLRATFVDVGQLAHLLSSANHQILFGRRGTGKTHALSMLASNVEDRGEAAIQVDLRRIGSTGGYQSKSTPIEHRCTQLLIDLLAALHSALADRALSNTDTSTELFISLDRLAETMTTVEVVGAVEIQKSEQQSQSRDRSLSADLTASAVPGMSASLGRSQSRSTVFERRITESGAPFLDINFGDIAGTLERITASLPAGRLWILLDEWSSLPIELQPLLAEFLRRALLAVPGLVVKIAAIEDRSHFRIAIPDGDHIGLELGADIMADINLDDFMIFDNDDGRSLQFFSTLLFRHLSSRTSSESMTNASEFVIYSFGDWGAFRELVRAAEGIPRDAINLAALAAQKADRRRMGIGDVRAAARDWYQRDKEGALKRPEARSLLALIIDEVVGVRKKRSFLLERGSGGSEDYIIRELYDARILHIIRRGISSTDKPSSRFDGFAVDYGCYVDFAIAERDRTAEYWIGEVPPDRFTLIKDSVLSLTALRSST